MSQKLILKLSYILAQNRSDRPLKYRFQELLQRMPTNLHKIIIDAISRDTGRSRERIAKWFTIRIGDTAAVNSDQMQVLARRLGVSVEDCYQNEYTIIDDINPPITIPDLVKEELSQSLSKTTQS